MKKKTVKKRTPKTNAEHAAVHYGFDYAEIKETSATTSGHRAEEEKIKVIKHYSKQHDLKRDIPREMFFYDKALLKDNNVVRGKASVGLDVIGVDNALAEGVAIQTALSILSGEGYKNLTVHINSIGDRDSVKRFEKELIAHYRRNNDTLKKPELKKLVLGSVLELYASDEKHLKELNDSAPRPMYFLSDESQKHFKDVLEYLESVDAPYEIQDNLIGDKNYFSKVIFTISGKNTGEKENHILARGGRYDEVAGEVTRKRKIAAVGLSMDFKAKSGKPVAVRPDVSIHLIKIGFAAKLKSLEVLEALKHVGVPIKHDLEEKKISQQIEHAMENDASYALIIGQREANMGKVLVRDMETSAQDEVKIEDLAKYVKKLV